MLIVLEGIDGGGKTSLANQLVCAAEAREWEAKILHKGPPTQSAFDEYTMDLLNAYPFEDPYEAASTLLVLDRWHLGEIVYGPLYRGRSQLTFNDLDKIDYMMTALGAVQLIISPPLDVVRSRLHERGETFLKPEDVEYVHSLYEALNVRLPNFNIIREPLDDKDVEIVLETALCRTQRSNRNMVEKIESW